MHLLGTVRVGKTMYNLHLGKFDNNSICLHDVFRGIAVVTASLN